MNTQLKPLRSSTRFIFMILTLFLIVSTAFAHGPKGHGSSEFTALQAVKKGIALYDQLVASAKLDEDWETNLINIKVSTRKKGKASEFVVEFSLSKDEPKAVYIFFTEKGKYSGSNFTGN
jgi:hypothetical protein